MKKFIFLFLLLSFNIYFAGFELRNYLFELTINSDGTAHATEDFLLFINDSYSITLYQESFVLNDLASWAERTNIPELRTHISRAYVDILNLRVRPTPVFNCNNLANTCYGKITLDYDIYPLKQNSTNEGLIKMTKYKPRTTLYVLSTKPLSFQVSKTDDIILPQGYSFKISIPENSKRIVFSRVPNNIPEDPIYFRYDSSTAQTYYLGKERMFIWSSQTLSKFYFSFEIEQSPEDEVKEFFYSAQIFLSNLFSKLLELPYLIAAITFLVSIYWLIKVGS
jgi:hypothetical protein